MRLAVLSDIHANLAALDAVRADLPRGRPGLGPRRHRGLRSAAERGDCRAAGDGRSRASWATTTARRSGPWIRATSTRMPHAAINWTAGVLDDNARAYLAALPEVRRDGDLTAVHGSPRDPIWEYIVSTARGGGEPRRLRHPLVPASATPTTRSSSTPPSAASRRRSAPAASEVALGAPRARQPRQRRASRATGTRPPPTSCWIPMPVAPPTAGSPTTSTRRSARCSSSACRPGSPSG